jgi:fructoselysine-6-P-deglycase FrlB-like protein
MSRVLRGRLEAHIAGNVHAQAIDILLTGCEVSLWLTEQFASDLQKSFPKLRIKAVSSNKLLGLYGQEIAVPALGFPYAPKTYDLNDAIVIIVSHSGGTFAPLSCSNLLQVGVYYSIAI